MKAYEKESCTTNPTAADMAFASFHPLRVLIRRRWQLLACLLVVATIAFAATVLRKPLYEANARVQVVMDNPKISGSTINSQFFSGPDYFTTQCQLLKSRHVISRAAEKMNANGDRWPVTAEGLDELQRNVVVSQVTGSRLIDIIGIAETGAQAAAIANQVTAAFIETSTEARRASTAGIVERMEKQIANYDHQMGELEDKISRFRQEYLVLQGEDLVTATSNRIRNIEKDLGQAQSQELIIRNLYEQIKETLSSGHGLDGDGGCGMGLDEDAGIRSLINNINKLKEDESQLAQVYLPSHQKLQAARMRIASLEERLADQRRQTLQEQDKKTAEKLAVVTRQVANLQTQLDEQKVKVINLAGKQQDYARLLKDMDMVRDLRAECVRQVRQFILQENIGETPVVVVDAAHIPKKTAGMSKTQRASSVLLLGLLFSVVFVFTLDRFSHSPQTFSAYGPTGAMPATNGAFYYWNPMSGPVVPAGMAPVSPMPVSMPTAPVADAESEESSWVLGHLGRIELGGNRKEGAAFAARCQVVRADQSSLAAETFREITSQLLGRFGRTHQSMVLTGTKAQNGKTTCAVNLALALAQSGRKVVLVDFNQRRPVLHQVFNNDSERPGVNAVLADHGVLEEALQDTDIANLKVMHQQPGEPWNGQDVMALGQLDTDLRRRFDWVIYDADAITNNWTQAVLEVIGKALFISSEGDGRMRHTALQQIEQAGALSMGCIESSYQAVNNSAEKQKTVVES